MPLEDDVRELAERVARIEHALGISPVMAEPVTADVSAPPAQPAVAAGRIPFLCGRALLGLAGAYLLRALTESQTLPAGYGVAAGILYAILWMVWAARTPSAERLETALHSLTAALVLCPLLWEAAMRFQAVSDWTASAILLLFILFGLGISWRKDILILATIATLAALGTAVGLLLATHDVLPFTLLFLAAAAAVEGSACLGHWLSERWLAATTANLSVLLATWLVTNERGIPPNYAPIPHAWLLAALVLLLAIYLSSTIVRTLLRGFTFTFFETVQCGLALAIALNGGLRLSEEDPRIAPAVAALALVCAAACYLVSTVRLDHGRNFYTYSTFGILLTLAGTRILLPLEQVALLWLALAAVSVWAGIVRRRSTLQVHGAIYLALGLLCLGVLQQAASALMATTALAWPAYLGAAAAAACYLMAGAGLLRLAFAAVLALLLAAMAAALLTHGYHAIFGEGAVHSWCSTLRTCVLAGGSFLLAWAAGRWRRIELQRLIYPTMVLAAYRLFTDDLHQEAKAAAVISLLVYGTVLMLLPKRLARQSIEASH
jgi:hypothetical protein